MVQPFWNLLKQLPNGLWPLLRYGEDESLSYPDRDGKPQPSLNADGRLCVDGVDVFETLVQMGQIPKELRAEGIQTQHLGIVNGWVVYGFQPQLGSVMLSHLLLPSPKAPLGALVVAWFLVAFAGAVRANPEVGIALVNDGGAESPCYVLLDGGGPCVEEDLELEGGALRITGVVRLRERLHRDVDRGGPVTL